MPLEPPPHLLLVLLVGRPAPFLVGYLGEVGLLLEPPLLGNLVAVACLGCWVPHCLELHLWVLRHLAWFRMWHLLLHLVLVEWLQVSLQARWGLLEGRCLLFLEVQAEQHQV